MMRRTESDVSSPTPGLAVWHVPSFLHLRLPKSHGVRSPAHSDRMDKTGPECALTGNIASLWPSELQEEGYFNSLSQTAGYYMSLIFLMLYAGERVTDRIGSLSFPTLTTGKINLFWNFLRT